MGEKNKILDIVTSQISFAGKKIVYHPLLFNT
jgi:hypothetical protein